MSTPARQFAARVEVRERLSEHLVRLTLSLPNGDFESTQIPDEWIGLVVPGQFQSRYYTVRYYTVRSHTVEDDGVDLDGAGALTLDVVVHDAGLVTEWVTRPDCVGSEVTIHEAKGSFELPKDASWLMLVGDLTALPAIARIAETAVTSGLTTRIWAEVADPELREHYLPTGLDVTWLVPAAEGTSRLAEVVEGLPWPEGTGYFWMAGESAQMRAIRRFLMRERGLPASAYDVMGYWRDSGGRQPRAVDPGPIWRRGKALGLGDEQIWAQYDEARS